MLKQIGEKKKVLEININVIGVGKKYLCRDSCRARFPRSNRSWTMVLPLGATTSGWGGSAAGVSAAAASSVSITGAFTS